MRLTHIIHHKVGVKVLTSDAESSIPRRLKRVSSKKNIFLISFMVTLTLLGLILAPASGAEITEYSLTGDYRPRSIAVAPSGNVWFTEQLGNRIGRISGTTIYEWKLLTLGSEPWDITVDDEENVWFTEYHAHHVARFREGVLVEFDITGNYPTGITVDNDPSHQNIWFAEHGDVGKNGKIGKLYYNDTTGLKNWILIEYTIPPRGGTPRKPYDVAVSPVNGYVWYTDQSTHNIGSFNPWTIQFKEYNIAATSGLITGSFKLWGITVDRDGFVWAAVDLDDGSKYDKICRLNPWTAEATFYDIPSIGADPRDITVDSDGNIWFTESSKNKIARLNYVNRFITEFEAPTSGSYPMGIAVKSGSTTPIWFTEWSANKIGKISPEIGKTYSTVITITSATTQITQSLATSTSTIPDKTTETLYSKHTISTLSFPPTTITATPTVTYWTAAGTNSTDWIPTATSSTNTETVFVIPTSTTATTTSYIVSTSVTETTKTDTLTTYVSTTSTTTTTTTSATYFTAIATESTVVTRQAIYTDVVTTETQFQYEATRFKDATVTELFYTSYSTTIEPTTVTSYTTTTITTLVFITLTSGLGWGAPLIVGATLFTLWLKRRRNTK